MSQDDHLTKKSRLEGAKDDGGATRPDINSMAPRRARQLSNENLIKHNPAQTAQDMGGPFDPYDENLAGMRIGDNYEIIEKIGEGGMSAVYLGRHIHLGREVAVKMLHPHLIANRVSRERFSQEARAVSQIEHVNVVRLLDFGITEENRPYIVMDLLRGNALSQIIKVRGPMDVERALPIFMQICDALAYTHAKGIVHRDLKPSNVILLDSRRENQKTTVKIVDFGIAKLSFGEDAGVAALTQTGDVFGSPLYMSPEQARGEKLDNRADIYSMGCLMYEMLTGVTPITGSNMLEILYRHMNEMPAPMSSAAPGMHIPRNLEAIVFKALAKDPKDRYQDMQALEADLENFESSSQGFSESVRSLWSLYRSRRKKLNLREKIATAAIFVFIGATIIGSGIFALFYFKGAADFSGAQVTWLKKQHKNHIENLYGERTQFVNVSNRSAEARLKELKAQIARGETATPTDQDYDTLQLLSKYALDLRARDDLDKAAETIRTFVEMSSIVHGVSSLMTRQGMTLEFMNLYDQGKYAQAQAYFSKMRREIPEPLLYPEARYKALLFSLSGDCNFQLGKYEAARSDLLEALNNWEEADRDKEIYDNTLAENKALATSYFADTFALDGLWEEAAKYYGRAIAQWKAAGPPRDDYNQAVAFFKRSLAESHLKDEKKADIDLQKARELLHRHPKDFFYYQTEVQMMQLSAKLDQDEGRFLAATQKYIQAGLIKNRSGAISEK